MEKYIEVPKGEGDELETPRELFRYWDSIFYFDRDVACTKANQLAPCVGDAFTDDWGFLNWLNPPYSKPGPFLKAAKEWQEKGRFTLALVKLDPSTKWWNEHVRGETIRTLTRRIRFWYKGRPTSHVAPFPSALVFYWPK